MNKKYLGKSVALPTATHGAVVLLQKQLTKRLGFDPSLSDTIAYAVRRALAESAGPLTREAESQLWP